MIAVRCADGSLASPGVPRDAPSDGSYGEYAQDYTRACPYCGSVSGEHCRDVEPGQDSVGYMRAVHGARIFGPGKILIRHTRETLPSGEGVFESVEPAGSTP